MRGRSLRVNYRKYLIKLGPEFVILFFFNLRKYFKTVVFHLHVQENNCGIEIKRSDHETLTWTPH